LIFLGVDNEDSLKLWSQKLNDKEKLFKEFREPDLGGQMTAIACIDTGEVFRKLSIV